MQAEPNTARTKVWGAFGPETDCWEFDTPESGWKLLDPYMPGVWLYPVLQDRKKIRLFFTGSPNGQVDLVPVTAPVETLLQYPVLILPGWNTMTREIYDNLCEYADRVGNPVIVEKRHTKGRVWLLCAAEYWGARALDLLLPHLCGRIVRENQQPVRLTGDTDDVDFYVFTQDDKQRIVLLNTDWTSDRNRKYVCVNTSGLRMETSVTEGRAKHILVKKNAALSFEVPSAIIADFTVSGDRLSFTVRGAGPVSAEVFTEPCVRVVRSSAGEQKDNRIRIDMGNTWSEREIVVFLQRTE